MTDHISKRLYPCAVCAYFGATTDECPYCTGCVSPLLINMIHKSTYSLIRSSWVSSRGTHSNEDLIIDSSGSLQKRPIDRTGSRTAV
jgi:hypothetical protein